MSSSCVHFAHLWFYESLTVHVHLSGQRALSDSHWCDWLELLNLFMFYAKGCSVLCLLGIWTISTAFRGGMEWIDLIKQLDDVWTNQNKTGVSEDRMYFGKDCIDTFWNTRVLKLPLCSGCLWTPRYKNSLSFCLILLHIMTGTFAHSTLTQFDTTGHLWAIALHLVLIFAEKKYEGKYCTNS